MDDLAKKQIKTCLLERINGISNKEYQKRVWINAIGPECDSYDETVNIFLPCSEDVIERYKEFGLTKKQYHELAKFRGAFASFKSGPGLDYYEPIFFIDTPEWDKITLMAKEVLETFDYHKKFSTYFREYTLEFVLEEIAAIEKLSEENSSDKQTFFEKCDIILENADEFELSRDQRMLLQNFRNIFKTYCAKNEWPPLDMETSEVNEVKKNAREVLKTFHYQQK